MKAIAQDAKSTRAGLYKALNGKGNPEFRTIHRVLNALGYRFAIHRLQPKKSAKKATKRSAKQPEKKSTVRKSTANRKRA